MTGETQQPGAAERRDRMRALIEQRGFESVAGLSEEFGVSTVTVRHDLDALEAEGGVRRVRGGAVPFDTAQLRELPFEEAAVEAAGAKARIGAAAADLLEPGMSVFLDVAPTATAGRVNRGTGRGFAYPVTMPALIVYPVTAPTGGARPRSDLSHR